MQINPTEVTITEEVKSCRVYLELICIVSVCIFIFLFVMVYVYSYMFELILGSL